MNKHDTKSVLNLHDVYTILDGIIHQAADLLRDYYARPLAMSTKASISDIVTEADKAIEAFLVPALLEHFPDTHIVGEEGGGYGTPIESASYRWYIDPIDGTTNFANKIPYFAISVGLTDQDMTPLLGMVYNPITNELYAAVKGQGTTLNGEEVRVTDKTSLAQSVLATGFPYDKATNPNNNTRQYAEFVAKSRATRCFGAAALDLCYVACGRLDGYWEGKLNPWDCVAGVLCVLEAGGKITNYDGVHENVIYEVGQIVASNNQIHDEILELLNQT